MKNFKIVLAEEEHLGKISEIERECFSIPRTLMALVEDWENENCMMLTAIDEETGEIYGYGAFTYMFGEAEVTNICVKKSSRHEGIGYAISEALLNKAKSMGMTSLILEVRKSNESAKKIYKALGFNEIAVRPNFYQFPQEDGISMIVKF